LNVEAIVISTDEPQLPRCVESVATQTIPFSKVTHINNVVPEHVAFNYAMKIATEEWAMMLGGDFILYPHALALFIDAAECNTPKTFLHTFRLWDGIVGRNVPSVAVLKPDVMRIHRNRNLIRDDWEAIHRLQEMGWERVDHKHLIAGTHCENPSDFQIFNRFFIAAIKFGEKTIEHSLNRVRAYLGEEKYRIALDAVGYGREVGRYPGSHNANFDKEVHERYLKSRETVSG